MKIIPKITLAAFFLVFGFGFLLLGIKDGLWAVFLENAYHGKIPFFSSMFFDVHPFSHYQALNDSFFAYLKINLIYSALAFGMLFLGFRFLKPEKYGILLAYVLLSGVIFWLRRTDIITSGISIEGIFNRTAPAPELYRVLTAWISFCLVKASGFLSWNEALLITSFAFCLVLLPCFHIYLRRWFSTRMTFVIVLFFSALLPISFLHDVTTDMPELVIFIVGYMLIRDNLYQPLIVLIFFATLNRETSLLLVVAYGITFFSLKREKLKKLILRMPLLFAGWGIPYVALKFIQGYRENRYEYFLPSIEHNAKRLLGALSGVAYNSEYVAGTIFFLTLLFIPVFYSFKVPKDNFLRRNVLTSGLFIVGLNIFTRFEEFRVFYPIVPLVIPWAFYSLFNEQKLPADSVE